MIFFCLESLDDKKPRLNSILAPSILAPSISALSILALGLLALSILALGLLAPSILALGLLALSILALYVNWHCSWLKDKRSIKDGNSPCRLECEKFRDHDHS